MDSTIPNLVGKGTAIGTDVIYITDGINDYQITLTRILTFINTNLSNITEAQISLADNTTNNASTAKHGFVPKLPNDATRFYNGVGGFAVPTGITNSAGNNVIPKSNGTNLVASRISDDGTTITLSSTTGSTDDLDIYANGGIFIGGNLTNGGGGSLGINLQQSFIGDFNGDKNGTVIIVDDSNQLITSTKPIQVNDLVVLKDRHAIQLLTDQQGVVADATILLSSVVTQFNSLLAKLRAHGLIAT